MLRLLDQNRDLFASWKVIRYEQEGDAYLLQITAVLTDDSRLQLRDYVFADGSRKYAYHWMEDDGTLRRRWDNAPHWPDVPTTPITCTSPIRKNQKHPPLQTLRI